MWLPSAPSAARAGTTCRAKWERRRASARCSGEGRYPRPMLSQRAPKTESNLKQTPSAPTSPSSSRSQRPSPTRSPHQSPSPQPTSPSPQQKRPSPKPRPKRPGRKLLAFDRRLGARFVAGTDEAGRGSLAGPLVVAGVLLDYESLRDHRVRPLALLNDSKQVSPEDREALFRAVLAAATQISVQMISHKEIDREGLPRSNLPGF